VHGYPTVKFVTDGISKLYSGPRQANDFIHFVDRMTRPSITIVDGPKLEKILSADPNKIFFALVTGEEDAEETLKAKNVFTKAANAIKDASSPEFFEIKDVAAAKKY